MQQSSARVPDELMQQLHQATQHFHDCKLALERAMDSTDYDHERHVDEASARLREAERGVELIEEKIKEVLSGGAG